MLRRTKAKIFATKLRKQMAEKNITALQVAAACGVSRQSVYYYLEGRRLPNIGIIPELSKLFGVDCDYWVVE